MAALTVNNVTSAGVAITAATPAGGGDTFANTGREMVRISNASGGSITATFVTTKTVDGNAVSDLVVTITNGQTKVIGRFDPATYNDANGLVSVTCSATSSVTIEVYKQMPL